jgi:hypothetical protein
MIARPIASAQKPGSFRRGNVSIVIQLSDDKRLAGTSTRAMGKASTHAVDVAMTTPISGPGSILRAAGLKRFQSRMDAMVSRPITAAI